MEISEMLVLVLLNFVAASIGFKEYSRLFKGDSKVLYNPCPASFGAWFEDSPGDCIDLRFIEDRLRISATSNRIWCLVFSEGQLIYPSRVQQGHATEIPSHDGMEVYVVFFDNYPRTMAGRLDKVDTPLNIDELDDFIQTWQDGGCSLFRLEISHHCGQIDPTGDRVAWFLSTAVIIGLIAWWIFAEIIMKRHRLIDDAPTNSGWINVVCENGRFSNKNFNFSEEVIKVMVRFCLNASEMECKSSLTDFPDWPKQACYFRGGH